MARGQSIAHSRDSLPIEYFDAIAEDSRFIEALEYETNAARDLARAKARKRGGLPG